MTDAQRKAKCDEFKEDYFARMGGPHANVTSERRTIVENLCELHQLVEPDMIPGPLVQEQSPEQERTLGRFRDREQDRKCITDDMDIIRFYVHDLGEEPPSFLEAGPRRHLYHDPQRVRVALLTSGGIAPGLNTVVETIVRRHVLRYGLRVDPVWPGEIMGFRDGFAGLEEESFDELDQHEVRGWCRLGGSKLGVGRGSTDVHRWLEVLAKYRIDIVYVIGGNGSVKAAWELAEAAKQSDLRLSVAVVPKTMDNDVLWVWQSFGFVTAFDKAAEIIARLHTEAEACSRVCVIQLFGAQSGHVAANASLASGDVDAVLIPEQEFEPSLVCEHIVGRLTKMGQQGLEPPHALVVMGEGARPMEKVGEGWHRMSARTSEQKKRNFERMLNGLRHALKNAGLERHGVFGNQPQYVIRSVPPDSHDQVYCRRLADMVVDSCLGGYTNFMISSWLTEYVMVPLKFAARGPGTLTEKGYKTFPTGGVFWRTVLSSTGQPSFLSDEARSAIEEGEIEDEE